MGIQPNGGWPWGYSPMEADHGDTAQSGTCKTKPRRGAASGVTEFSKGYFQLILVPK
jgi:hypothetical protein